MELKIGTNIKRLRLLKGITQEQLAELLCISTAAVSKWEARNSYPDITLLFPLAEIFGVSVDELLGYDEVKAKNEIEKLISEYKELHIKGCFEEAKEVLADAKKKYPHDYLVMSTYMWDKAGGYAGNRPEIILENYDELSRICNCILEGCTVESIRHDALNMKAKLLHAQNDTDGALEILAQLPSWGDSSQQKTEQLFARHTTEYRYWNIRNCYALMDNMGIKLARRIRFDDSLSVNEKMTKLERMGDEISALCKKPDLECFCIVSQAVYAILGGMLTAEDNIDDVIRIREKQFISMESMMKLAERDISLKDAIEKTYKTVDIIAWNVDRFLNSPHPQFAKLRENKDYMEMLLKWKM